MAAFRASCARVGLLVAAVLALEPPVAVGGEFESGAAALAGRDVAESVQRLLPLAQQGDDAARMQLLSIAGNYRHGVGVPQQCSRAVDLLTLLVGMEHLPSFVNLGHLYLHGCVEVAANPEEGIRLVREAADKGDAGGQVLLGSVYANGLGVPRDFAEAMRWYRRAADRGVPQGQFDVGLLYLNGEGVRRDLGEAERWLGLAAAQGHDRAKTVLLSVASLHAAGQGTPRRCTHAIEILRGLADAGFAPASVQLGGLYLRGCGEVAPDVAEGVRLTRTYAERGDATAQANLGLAHATGTGVPLDYGEALRWNRMSAAQGSPLGQAHVGLHYLWGQGVARDVAEAKRWFALAAAQHHGPARELLARIEAEESQDPHATAIRAAARSAPAGELAWRFAHETAALDALRLIGSGWTLQLPEGAVTPQNLEATRADFVKRAAIDAGVIRERGSGHVHGRYRATAEPACAGAKSAWAGPIATMDVREVELRQDGFLARIEQRGRAGEAIGFHATAVVVESSLAFPDPMNMDYALVGTVTDGTITVRPDVDTVLRNWPEWAGPPSREALSACVVTLTRIDGAAVREAPAAGTSAQPAFAGGTAAAHLARSYADTLGKRKIVLALISGELVRMPEKPNAQQTYAREKEELDAREARLAAEIRQRGFANLAGRYRATAPPACRQVQSSWVAAVASGVVREVDVSQDGFVATVVERVPRGYVATAIVVESTLVTTNPRGGGHSFVGAVESDVVRLHPDVGPRPTQPSSIVSGLSSVQALADCVVTLTRVP